MKERTPDVPAQWVPPTGSDEINLRELVLVLWRQKLLILLVAGVFAIVGIAYALLAPQTWSANAVIQVPERKDLLPMLRVASQAKSWESQVFLIRVICITSLFVSSTLMRIVVNF